MAYKWKRIELNLTEDQQRRGVIFSSALINKTIGDEVEDDVIHEVFWDNPDKGATILRLLDVSFFKDFAEECGYEVYEIIRN